MEKSKDGYVFSKGVLWLALALMACGSLLIICLSLTLGKNANASRDLDFAGMLLSDGLALVAILYAMIQGWASRTDTNRLVDAVESLKNVSVLSQIDVRNMSQQVSDLKGVSMRLEQFLQLSDDNELLKYRIRTIENEVDLTDREQDRRSATDPPEIVADSDRLKNLVKVVRESAGMASSLRNLPKAVRSRWEIQVSVGSSNPSSIDMANIRSSTERSFFSEIGSGSFTFLPINYSDISRTFTFILDVTSALNLNRDLIVRVVNAGLPSGFILNDVNEL